MTTSAAASAEIAKVAQTAVTTEELLSGDSNILDQLLLMFEKGLNQPIVYWQLASILGSLFLAWLLGKYIRMRIIKHLAAEFPAAWNVLHRGQHLYRATFRLAS